jgi:hypothetical protein
MQAVENCNADSLTCVGIVGNSTHRLLRRSHGEVLTAGSRSHGVFGGPQDLLNVTLCFVVHSTLSDGVLSRCTSALVSLL